MGSRIHSRRRQFSPRIAAADVEVLESRQILSVSAPTFDPVDVTENPPTFQWNAVPSATQYRITIKNLETGDRANDNHLATPTFTPADPLSAGEYRAWVRSVGADGQLSSWSSPLNFTIDSLSLESEGFQLRPQPWKRYDEPVISSLSSQNEWSQAALYHPSVIYKDGKYQMWFTAEGVWEPDRVPAGFDANDVKLGYAESVDGIHWTEFDQPVLRAEDIPWYPALGTPNAGPAIMTPYVMFDDDEQLYKLWFSSEIEQVQDERGVRVDSTDVIGYATSPDGVHWNVWPEALQEGRAPSVIKEGPNQYRMWANARPSEAVDDLERNRNIFEFTSSDGIHWTRSAQSVVQPSGNLSTVIYPEVVKQDGRYYMWYSGHVANGYFETFFAKSDDGTHWQTDQTQAALPAARDASRFDGRYTSSLSVVVRDDRLLLFYSARDLDVNRYRHIGVAELTSDLTPMPLSIPVFNAPLGESPTTFSWSFDPAAERYELTLTNLSTGAQITQSGVQVNTFALDSQLDAGQYTALVRSVGFDGAQGAWSAPLTFTANGIPLAPRLASPTGNITDTTPTFTWNAVTGATRYHLEVKDLTTGRRPIRQPNLQTTEFTPATPLPPGKYRAWVRAYDAFGRDSGWSKPLDFEIVGSASTSSSLASSEVPQTAKASSPDNGDPISAIDFVMASWAKTGVFEIEDEDGLPVILRGRSKRPR